MADVGIATGLSSLSLMLALARSLGTEKVTYCERDGLPDLGTDWFLFDLVLFRLVAALGEIKIGGIASDAVIAADVFPMKPPLF